MVSDLMHGGGEPDGIQQQVRLAAMSKLRLPVIHSSPLMNRCSHVQLHAALNYPSRGSHNASLQFLKPMNLWSPNLSFA